MNKRIVYLIIALLVVAGALFALNGYLAREVGVEPTPDDSIIVDDGTVPETPEPVTEDSLMVPDQAAEGEIFLQEVAFLDEGPGGFVVIHRVTEEGEVGDIIGVSNYLAAGRHQNVLVTLNEGETVAIDESVIAMLHTDDGDQIFDGALDVPLTKSVSMEVETEEGTTTEMGEEIIMVTFNILDEEDLPGFETKL
jgi:hypothetical protein